MAGDKHQQEDKSRRYDDHKKVGGAPDRPIPMSTDDKFQEEAEGSSQDGTAVQPAKQEKGLSVLWAAVFVVANIAGSGVLPMGRAVINAGWIGMALIVLCCLEAGYLGTRLAKCWVFLEERFPQYRQGVRSPYAAIGQEAYGQVGRVVVSITNNVGLFGVSVVFIILCAQNMTDLLQDSVPEMDQCLWTLVVAGALCPLTWLGSPKEFWWAGLLALLTTVIACVMIIVQSAIDAPDVPKPLVYPNPTFQSFFLAFGSILFAFGGASSFPTIQNDMNDKTKFVKSVNMAFVGLLLIFFPVGAMGYFVFGDQVKDNILLNLSDGFPKISGQILISLHVFFAFLIVSNPVYQELEELLKIPNKFGWKRVALRTGLVALALFIAESVPSFGRILDLVGGSTVSMMTFILPPIFYMKLADSKGPTWQPTPIPLWERVFLWECALIGLFGGVAATYSAISAIVENSELAPPCYLQ